MGAGEAKRPLAVRMGASALRGFIALALFILVLLLILRGLAAWREGEATAPAGTTYFATPAGHVAARVAGPADGIPVVLVHGTAAWSGFWSEVADHLAQQGWRVIAIDLPPFGWSDRDPSARYDRITQAERLSAILGVLGKPAVVVGHSFGAGAVTELGLRHPEQVRGLVLVDAALGELDPKTEAPVAKVMRAEPVAQLATSAIVTNPNALEPFLRSLIERKEQAHRWIPVLREPMLREGSTSAYAAWLPNLLTKQDGALSRRSATLSAIKIPVALIWGDADTVTPLPQGKRIEALTRARSLTILSGVGHIPHIEDPAAFQAALDQSLKTVTKEKE
ncbi:alpha/beta hydrolase [Sphingomonas daechungensis]|uniref:alpha/beta fold hydrolase n=1 Tax=Sphingomonas daechungensis TaxID=1176646 RepID=UPI0031EDF8A3